MKKLLILLVLLSIGRLWWLGKISMPRVSKGVPKSKQIEPKTKLKFTFKEITQILDHHYSEGAKGFFKTVKENLDYPISARQRCMYGIVVIGIEIDYRAKMSYKVIKPSETQLNEAALNALWKTKDKWKTMLFGHSPVRFELGFTFMLDSHPKIKEGHIVMTGPTANAKCLLDENYHQ